MPKNSTIKKNRIELIEKFELASSSTLFNQQTVCAVLDCSTSSLERHRWAGTGIPYIKIGAAVRYRKSDILNFIDQQSINPIFVSDSRLVEITNNLVK